MSRDIVFVVDTSSHLDPEGHLESIKKYIQELTRWIIKQNNNSRIGVASYGSFNRIDVELTNVKETLKESIGLMK